jgi:hypothetical protein
MADSRGQTLVRVGALVLIAGELVVLATQLKIGAAAFVTFILVGGGLTALGVVLALWGMVRSERGP